MHACACKHATLTCQLSSTCIFWVSTKLNLPFLGVHLPGVHRIKRNEKRKMDVINILINPSEKAKCGHGAVLTTRARVRWISAADRVLLGAYRYRRFIVDLSSLFLAPRSMKYRRYIVDISSYIDDISSIYELHVTFLFTHGVQGAPRGPCLKGSITQCSLY